MTRKGAIIDIALNHIYDGTNRIYIHALEGFKCEKTERKKSRRVRKKYESRYEKTVFLHMRKPVLGVSDQV